jgi:hypothetical protein
MYNLKKRNMYYTCKVQIKTEDDKGKIKKNTQTYLVDATGVTEVEAIVTKQFISFTGEWEIKSIAISPICSVIFESGDVK